MTNATTHMTIGIPRETKTAENRVALTPEAVRELVSQGVQVSVETSAGSGASIEDREYEQVGARIVQTAAEAWSQQMVVKVKEPQASEFQYLREDLTLFTYLHLAAYPKVAEALTASKTTAVAYETVQTANGALPLLAPMSEIAGRLAPQMAAQHLERHNGGRGVLLSGAPGVKPAHIVVLGAGVVGFNAAWIASGMGADVTILDKNIDRLRWVDDMKNGRIKTLTSNRGALEQVIQEADAVIGAVLLPGGRAPVLVTEAMVRTMKPGSVLLDVAVDQGGCIETTKETTHNAPTFMLHSVVHYAVGNMPGAVPRTSAYALSNATLPYVALIATKGLKEALQTNTNLVPGLTTVDGKFVNIDVAQSLGVEPLSLSEALRAL
jgi:alanine dehydrogenase